MVQKHLLEPVKVLAAVKPSRGSVGVVGSLGPTLLPGLVNVASLVHNVGGKHFSRGCSTEHDRDGSFGVVPHLFSILNASLEDGLDA